MKARRTLAASIALAVYAVATPVVVQAQAVAPAVVPPPPALDPVAALVGQLNLEQYKATIKGLTQFGDRRQGTGTIGPLTFTLIDTAGLEQAKPGTLAARTFCSASRLSRVFVCFAIGLSP